MGMTIKQAEKLLDDLATQEELLCKRADDASGYTRSGNESIRTSNAKTHEQYAKEYRQILRYLAEYRLMQADYEARLKKNNELINDLEELRTIINKFAESYETRLKADMVAMLEEIDLEMSEQSFGIQTESWEVVEKLRKEIIQQKINALKENTDGTDHT